MRFSVQTGRHGNLFLCKRLHLGPRQTDCTHWDALAEHRHHETSEHPSSQRRARRSGCRRFQPSYQLTRFAHPLNRMRFSVHTGSAPPRAGNRPASRVLLTGRGPGERTGSGRIGSRRRPAARRRSSALLPAQHDPNAVVATSRWRPSQSGLGDCPQAVHAERLPWSGGPGRDLDPTGLALIRRAAGRLLSLGVEVKGVFESS